MRIHPDKIFNNNVWRDEDVEPFNISNWVFRGNNRVPVSLGSKKETNKNRWINIDLFQ